jgi:hypothetical protein
MVHNQSGFVSVLVKNHSVYIIGYIHAYPISKMTGQCLNMENKLHLYTQKYFIRQVSFADPRVKEEMHACQGIMSR